MKTKRVILVCLILILTFITFLPALQNGFTTWDDGAYVTNNSLIASLSFRNIKRIFTSFYIDGYQPITLLSFLFEYHFFNLDPLFYHLTNLILHLFNCTLVFWLIFSISGRASISFITTILFAVHPLQVETVAWISERKGLLYVFFYLASIISYIYYLRKGDILKYYIALSFFILSCLSKATAVALPFVLFFIDYILYRKRSRLIILDKIPFFVLSFIFGVVTIFAHYSGTRPKEAVFIDLPSKIIQASYSVIFYLKKIFIPVKLSCLYPYPAKAGLLLQISPIIFMVLFLAIIYSRKVTRKVIFGSAFFLFSILPVLQFIKVGESLVADRYVYLASVGIFYIFSEMSVWIYSKKIRNGAISKTALIIILFIIVGLLSISANKRTFVWRDSFILWGDVLNSYPSALAYNNRGIAHYAQGDVEAAFSDYNKAIQIDPAYFEAYVNRGIAHYGKGDFDLAISDYKKAIEINPKVSNAYYDLGLAYLKKNDFDEAIFNFNKAIEIYPNYSQAYLNRASAYFHIQKYDLAREDLLTVEKILGVKTDPQLLKMLQEIPAEK